MTREEAINLLSQMRKDGEGFLSDNTIEAYDMAIKALEQEPCEDAISRQWLMECVNEGWIKFDTEEDENRFIHLIRDIAPPVTPQPKTGKWIYEKNLKQFFCNKCGYPSLTDDDKYIYSMDLPNFCENCGAKMIEPQERSGEE